MGNSKIINVTEAIDSRPFGAFQLQIVLICALVAGLDGYDAQVIGYAAPALIKTWHIPPQSLGPAFVMGQVGFMVGTLLVSSMADYIGRKAVAIGGTALFGLLTLATVFARNVDHLIVLRFLTGVAVGGVIPTVIVLTSEFTPRRLRAGVVMTMVCGISFGSIIGGALSAYLIPRFGWSSVFLAGGIAPLLILAPLALRLPESLQFLVLRPGNNRRMASILNRLVREGDFSADAVYVSKEERRGGLLPAHLFRGGRSVTTLLLWLIYFMNSFVLFFLVSWLPTIASMSGLSFERAAVAGAVMQGGGIVAILLFGRTVDRLRSPAVIAVFYLVGAIFLYLTGGHASSPSAALFMVFFAGFGIVGSFQMINGVAPGLYPTFIRSTGVGVAYTVGRIGAIMGPLFGAYMIAWKVAPGSIFMMAAIPALIAGLGCVALGYCTKGMIGAEKDPDIEAPRQRLRSI